MAPARPIPFDTDHSPSIVVELIYRLKVRDVMTRDIVTAMPSDKLRCVQQAMKESSISGVPIVDGRRLVGIVSMDDVIRALDHGYIDDPVTARMTRNVIVLEDDMPLSFAINYLEKYSYGRFPVLNAGKELVGIVTSRDIIIALLVEINKEIARFEQRETSESSESGFHLEATTRPFDFENAGRLSTQVKQRLKERGVEAKTTRRIAVACYELEMNQVVHSAGGRLSVTMSGQEGRVTVTASDMGPGIPDVDLALQEGYSTATEWVRSLGFGAGMGLPNVVRVSDEFDIQSSPAGTAVMATIRLGQGEQ